MADYDSDCDYDTKPRLEAKLGLGRIVSRLIDPFLVSITRIHGRSSGPRVSCPSFYAITSYANDIAYNNRASPTFVNNDGDEEEDEVPITVDDERLFIDVHPFPILQTALFSHAHQFNRTNRVFWAFLVEFPN